MRGEMSIGLFFQCGCSGARPCLEISTNWRREASLKDNIRNSKTPPRDKHAVGLSKYLPFVGREVNHAVGDHDINGMRWQRNIFYNAFQEAHVLYTRLNTVTLC